MVWIISLKFVKQRHIQCWYSKVSHSNQKPWNLEHTAKVRENHTKYWKSQGIKEKCYLVIFKLTVYYFAEMDQVSVRIILEKWKKHTGKVREFCQSRKVGTNDSGFSMNAPHFCNSFVTNAFCFPFTGFPLGLKNLEKWEGFFQSGNFEEIAKVRENHTKYWKNHGISDKCYSLFLVIFKWTDVKMDQVFSAKI